MPSASSAPAAPPTDPAAAVAAPVVRAVAEDLESIFPPEPAATPPRSARLRLGRRPRERKRVPDRRAAGVGALVAAACVGVSAGALLARPGAAHRTAPPPDSPGVPIALASAPGPGPLAPVLANVQGPAAPSTGPLGVAPPAAASPAAASLAADAARAQTTPQQRLHRVSAAGPAHPHHVTRTSARCAHGAHCGAASLTVADARLRRAYTAAERAGVARPVLADYHDEWRSLRRRAPHEPGLVAARYRQMAGDLNQLAARQRTARAEPPRVGPWRRFRMQLAALWR